jgi:predicted alpha-1,6-mannanase (GH76 family)
MAITHFVRPLLVSILFVPNILAQNYSGATDGPTEWSKCGLNGLGQWYNCTTGLYETAGWWNNANIMTMIGNLAQASLDDVGIQHQARQTFARALRNATAKNPAPGKERPSNGASSKTTRSGTPYSKYIDPKTFQQHAVYPAGWFDHSSPNNVKSALTTTCSDFDDEAALKDFTPDPYDWLDGYYDDDLWWALAWIQAYDVTRHPVYLDLAEGIFDILAQGWGTNCSNGGIFWNDEKTYVNAIANELFFSCAAHLATRADNTTHYTDWAQRSLTWFLNSGMINENGTINDGLTILNGTCENNNGNVWSYNQGVIVGGLVELNRATLDPLLLETASNITVAAFKQLTDVNGVLQDACDMDDSCGGDGTQFKGIMLRNVGKLQQAKPNDDFGNTIAINARSIWEKDRQDQVGGVVFGNRWAGPFVGPANASMQGSAMDAIVAYIAIDA